MYWHIIMNIQVDPKSVSSGYIIKIFPAILRPVDITITIAYVGIFNYFIIQFRSEFASEIRICCNDYRFWFLSLKPIKIRKTKSFGDCIINRAPSITVGGCLAINLFSCIL